MKDKPNYNRLPILHCKRCLKPTIKCDSAILPADEGKYTDEFRYCTNCGSVEVGLMNFYKWEQLYKDTFGLSYLEDIDVK